VAVNIKTANFSVVMPYRLADSCKR